MAPWYWLLLGSAIGAFVCSLVKEPDFAKHLALAILSNGDALSIADIVHQTADDPKGRHVSEGAWYFTLEELRGRGFVVAVRRPVVSADGKERTINFYAITDAGRSLTQTFMPLEVGEVS